MKPIFTRAKAKPLRLAYAEGEDERVLQAAQRVVEESIAHPILIGRRGVVAARIRRPSAGLLRDPSATGP